MKETMDLIAKIATKQANALDLLAKASDNHREVIEQIADTVLNLATRLDAVERMLINHGYATRNRV